MDLNVIMAIVFGVLFVIFATVGSVLMRNSTLQKLPALPGEKTLFEEAGVRVDQMLRGKNIVTIYTKSVVRVTNKRIITAQTPWFGKNKDFLRHVINYTESGPALETQGGGIFLKNVTVMKGFLTLYTTLDRITLEKVKDKPVIKITSPLKDSGPGFIKEPRVLIYTKNLPAWQQVFKNLV